MEEKPLESPLDDQDVRHLVRLLGEVIAAPGGIEGKRRLLLEGLCRLTGATSWLWCILPGDPDSPPSIHGPAADVLSGAEPGPASPASLDPPAMAEWIRASAIDSQAKGASSIPPPRLPGPEGPAAATSLEPAGIGALMTSTRILGEGGLSGIGIYRKRGLPAFTRREARIAHIIFSGVPWLHYTSFPEPPGERLKPLYPRHRTVLDLLCEGWSRKKIANHLGVSVNTVHGYVKAIFRHFDVHSQAGLIARFIKDGNP